MSVWRVFVVDKWFALTLRMSIVISSSRLFNHAMRFWMASAQVHQARPNWSWSWIRQITPITGDKRLEMQVVPDRGALVNPPCIGSLAEGVLRNPTIYLACDTYNFSDIGSSIISTPSKTLLDLGLENHSIVEKRWWRPFFYLCNFTAISCAKWNGFVIIWLIIKAPERAHTLLKTFKCN